MATVTVADAKNRFSDLLRRAEYGGERVVVERHGKPVAVIVSTGDLERLEALEDAADLRDAAAALDEAERLGTIPLDIVLRKHGLDYLLVRPPVQSVGRGGARPLARGSRSMRTTASKKRARR
jgi:prevent-host-death family protein